MDNQHPEQWHLSKSVPVSIVIFMIVQTIGLVIWATRLDSRVDYLERNDKAQDGKIDRMETIGARIAVIEDRQLNTITRLDIQTKTMQEILAIVGKIQK